jgi:L-alanine-DL-glutamate epimerase-like enolase superfamily enzyme
MKVAALRLTPFSIPLSHAVHFSTGVLTAAEHLLVEIDTEDGVTGISEAIPRPMIYGETAESMHAAILGLIAPQIIGLRIDSIEQIGHALRHLHGNPVAKGAVELAILDALGRTLGISCHRLFGGFTESVQVTTILGQGAGEEIVANAQQANATYGIESFKVKVGRDARADAQAIRMLREAMPEAIICPDANHGYTAAQALQFIDGVADCGLAWIEEPCPGEDLLDRRRIAGLSHTPFLGDETCINAREVATEILDGRSHLISIKLARTGVRESIRIREFCAAVGVGAIVGSQGDSTLGTWASVSFAAASPVTAARPAELGYFLDLKGSICAADPVIQGGRMSVPDGPGFGAEVDPDKLDSFREDR